MIWRCYRPAADLLPSPGYMALPHLPKCHILGERAGEVFRGAILASAAALVVGHNHPSGDASPSDEDAALTRRLREAGDLLGLPVLDHLIVGSHSAGSHCFVEAGR